MKKTGSKRIAKIFSVDFIDTNDGLYIHRYLMKKPSYKIMFWFIKKVLVRLLRVCLIRIIYEPLIRKDL